MPDQTLINAMALPIILAWMTALVGLLIFLIRGYLTGVKSDLGGVSAAIQAMIQREHACQVRFGDRVGGVEARVGVLEAQQAESIKRLDKHEKDIDDTTKQLFEICGGAE
jgi:hypothetical protein